MLRVPSSTPPPSFPRYAPATCIRSAAVNTFGAGGPSSMYAHCWQRLCTSFIMASDELHHSLLWPNTFVLLLLIHMHWLFLACRLIAYDKNPGVRPIGICEVSLQVITKAALSVVWGALLEAVGVHQLCAGQIVGVESAIHVVRQCFEGFGSEGLLFPTLQMLSEPPRACFFFPFNCFD